MRLFTRYLAGDWRGVWDDIRQDGTNGDDAELTLVALETMRRARRQLDEIIIGFRDAGFRPAFNDEPRTPPPPDVLERLARVESKLGPLPAVLRASVASIGAVCLSGDCPELGLTYHDPRPVTTPPPGRDYPDPLWLPGIEALEYEADAVLAIAEEEGTGPPYEIEIAADVYHKANISGGAQTIVVDAGAPDPVIAGIHGRPGVTYLQYLRTAVAWGGLPGFEFGDAPARLERLRRQPEF